MSVPACAIVRLPVRPGTGCRTACRRSGRHGGDPPGPPWRWRATPARDRPRRRASTVHDAGAKSPDRWREEGRGLARDVGALRGASPGESAEEDAPDRGPAGSGPAAGRLNAPARARKPVGAGHRILRGIAAMLAVLVVGVALAGYLLYQRLDQGPLSLQPLVPWLEAPIE